MTDSVSGARVSVPGHQPADPRPAQGAGSTGDSTNLIDFGSPPTQTRSAAPVLALQSIDTQGNRLATVPKAVVQLIADFLEVPHQVALGATSKAMHAAVSTQASHPCIYSLFTTMRQVHVWERELISVTAEKAQNDQLAAALGNWGSSEDEDFAFEQNCAFNARLADLHFDLGRVERTLHQQLTLHAGPFVVSRFPNTFGPLFIACERFLNASSETEKQKIFAKEVRPAAMTDELRPQLSGVVEKLDQMSAECRVAEMNDVVLSSRELMVSVAQKGLIKEWSQGLTQMFSGATA